MTLNIAQTAANATYDPWSACLFGFLERERILQHCPSTVAQAWPICYQRLTTLFNVIDPTYVLTLRLFGFQYSQPSSSSLPYRPVSDNRASLLRSSAPPKKTPSESQRDSLSRLWRNQVAMAMRLVPPVPSVAVRCASPDLSLRYVIA